ncbi:GNAT family N-acetyltransferase [Actinomadura keratinilytica]
MGVEIGRAYRRRGYGREAVSLLLGYMFREERFHKCEVEVYAFNEASLALFRGWGSSRRGGCGSTSSWAGSTTMWWCSGSRLPSMRGEGAGRPLSPGRGVAAPRLGVPVAARAGQRLASSAAGLGWAAVGLGSAFACPPRPCGSPMASGAGRAGVRWGVAARGFPAFRL